MKVFVKFKFQEFVTNKKLEMLTVFDVDHPTEALFEVDEITRQLYHKDKLHTSEAVILEKGINSDEIKKLREIPLVMDKYVTVRAIIDALKGVRGRRVLEFPDIYKKGPSVDVKDRSNVIKLGSRMERKNRNKLIAEYARRKK